MRRRAVLLPIALALGATILPPHAGAQQQEIWEQGPIKIKKCETISKSGSYQLANNLTAPGNCLVIAASFVSIDLAGFSISSSTGSGFGIMTAPAAPGLSLVGIAVRNGSISGFSDQVELAGGDGSIVEGLRISGPASGSGGIGIEANGIVRDNTAVSIPATAIDVGTGTVIGNYVSSSGAGIAVQSGSTVIGNTAVNNRGEGLVITCPSNVTNNTAVNNLGNLILRGEGCNNTNNAAP